LAQMFYVDLLEKKNRMLKSFLLFFLNPQNRTVGQT